MLTDHPVLHYSEALQNVPTAPFREGWMAARVDQLLADIPGVTVTTDRYGNRHVQLAPKRRAKKNAPIVFVSHMDHPGFIFPHDTEERTSDHRHEALFEGFVEDSYFPGERVRVFSSPEDAGTPGYIVECGERGGPDNNRCVVIETEEPVEDPVLAMWDLPAHERDHGRLASRACDDLCGVAAILAALRELGEGGGTVRPVHAIFTRAEEAGLCGTWSVLGDEECRTLLPEDGTFLSVEIPRENALAYVGGGAVLRVGDKAGVFDPATVNEMHRRLRTAPEGSPLRKIRRVLLDGGTTEAAAFMRYRLPTAGIIVPVVNYHNMNTNAGRIDVEEVDISDLVQLAEMMTWLASAPEADPRDSRFMSGERALRRLKEETLIHGNPELRAPSR